MKSFLVLALTVLSIHSQAASLAVECQGSDVQQLNKFSAVGLIETNSSGEAKGVLALSVTPAGPAKPSKDLGTAEVSGSAAVFAPGVLASNEITSLVLASKDEKAHMTLNLGLKSIASSSLLLEGVSYKAECSLKN